MSELELVGLHEDGEHIVLVGPDGQRFRLPIDEALRAAVRRDRPQLEQARAQMAGSLPPREIQARIRAGASAEEVAEQADVPIELVRRYEGPVTAEREFIARQAQATRIGHDPSAPVLGDLVTDRLATRSVPADSIRWDAYRAGSAPWTVEVSFVSGDAQRSARWLYDGAARTVRAVDDEARWLSETELADEPIPRRHLAAVRSSVFDVEVDAALRPLLASVDLAAPDPEPVADPHAETHALLDDLDGRRGVRQEVDLEHDDEDDDAFEGFGPQHAFDFDGHELGDVPAAHPPHSRPEEAVDARVLQMPASARAVRPASDEPARPAPPQLETLPLPGVEVTDSDVTDDDVTDSEATDTSVTDPEVPDLGAPTRHGDARGERGEHVTSSGPPREEAGAPARRGRKGRASVPSWDEIVFGAKPE